MSKKLYKYDEYFGRMGSLDGLFIEDERLREIVLRSKIEIDLGECLGKHSEVEVVLSNDTVSVVECDDAFVEGFGRIVGSTGTDPVDALLDMILEREVYEDFEDEGPLYALYDALVAAGFGDRVGAEV